MKQNHRSFKYSVTIGLLLVTLSLTLILSGSAQQGGLTLRAASNWDLSKSGICVHGGQSIVVSDLNNDGQKEIVTGGGMYYVFDDGTHSRGYAPIEIWNWNGTALNLSTNCSYPGGLSSLCAGDLDGDQKPELITTGTSSNDSGSYSSLRVWNLDGLNLNLRASYDGILKGSVGLPTIGDVDGDGKPEIVAVGSSSSTSTSLAQIYVFKFSGTGIAQFANTGWSARASSVCTYDLNKDGAAEIVTAGYNGPLKNSQGQLCVWNLEGTNLSLKSNTGWSMVNGSYSLTIANNPMGNTIASIVKIQDIDNNGVPDIVTAGFTYNGSNALAQVRIWNWNNGNLNLLKSHEWSNLDITQPTSLALADVDRDGKTEIITSGATGGYQSFGSGTGDKTRSELDIWSWNGNDIVLKDTTQWFTAESALATDSAWCVDVADINGDGAVEIATAGCAQVTNICDPDVRIWSLSAVNNSALSVPLTLLAVAGAAVIIIIFGVILYLRKRTKPAKNQ